MVHNCVTDPPEQHFSGFGFWVLPSPRLVAPSKLDSLSYLNILSIVGVCVYTHTHIHIYINIVPIVNIRWKNTYIHNSFPLCKLVCRNIKNVSHNLDKINRFLVIISYSLESISYSGYKHLLVMWFIALWIFIKINH